MYKKHAKSTTSVPVIPLSPIIDMVSGEDAAIPSFVDFDSLTLILIFLLLTVKENRVALYILCMPFYLMHIFILIIMFFFSSIDSHHTPKSFLDAMLNQGWRVTKER